MKRAVLILLILAGSTQRGFARTDDERLAGDPVPPSADDLAKAADAAAEVAAVPVDAPPPTPTNASPPAKASSDDIDLGSLGLDPNASSFDDKLNIYGFADIGFQVLHWTKNPVFFPQDTRSFAVGNFNLYLAKPLTPKARALAEVRFSFVPNGSTRPDGTIVDTTSTDSANFDRPVQWGGIIIERVHVEYDLTEHLTLRAGRWLTPYGIWNIDHGSPTIIGVTRPYIIGEQFFPEHQTGLDLFGNHYESGFKIDYHLTASNGRGATEATVDRDNKLAFGGRLQVETPWGVKVGGSYYRGRYTGLPPAPGMPAPTYREAAYGGDAQFDNGALHLQAELIVRDRDYQFGPPVTFDPAARDLGYYGLAGYRLQRFWNVMPYAFYESYEPADRATFSRVYAINAGLNFRPTSTLILKLQGTYPWFRDDGVGLLAGQTIEIFSAQASWVF